jgi:tetratricopeptide (TPR) repeat protein
MDILPYIFQVPFVIYVVILAWFAWDMHSIIKSSQHKNQLSIEGRWKDLDQHFERAAKSCRPFVWLHRHYLLPGAVAVQHALFLFNQGRLEEALVKADQAIRQVKGKPRVFRSFFRSATFKALCASFNARTLILSGLGRYGEARETAAQLEQLTGSSGRPNPVLTLQEYHCGHLDEVLAQAQAVPTENALYDSMRTVTVLACCMKGEFDQALQALSYEPSDISKFYSPAGLETMNRSPEGVKLLELQRRKHAGFFQPARLILLAKVYLAREEFENADRALDQAEKVMGPEPGLQATYCQIRACSLAAQGKAAEAENYIGRMRVIAQATPKRSLFWETHCAAARSYLHLGRPGDALAELSAAQRFVLHPLEKHVTAYWLARSHEAAGAQEKALQYYQIVAADTIPSWIRKQAAETLNRHNN